jgi:hypothetical protein
MAAPVTTAAPSANGQNMGPPPCQRAKAELIGATPNAIEATPAIATLLSLIMTNSHVSGAPIAPGINKRNCCVAFFGAANTAVPRASRAPETTTYGMARMGAAHDRPAPGVTALGSAAMVLDGFIGSIPTIRPEAHPN